MPVAKNRIEILQVNKLRYCVCERDVAQIEKLCASGVALLINYNEPEHGDTALNVAASRNDVEMVEFLLSLGAHPDVVDFKGRSTLMIAAEHGNAECFEVLAKAGANMHLNDAEGKGILWYCTQPTERHAAILDIALRYGADVNNKSTDGKPFFVEACQKAKEGEALCLTLLSNGADINGTHEASGLTGLMAACSADSPAVAKAILVAGADPNVVDKFNATAAHYAARSGSLACLAVLVAYGCKLDQQDARNKFERCGGGWTPLHYAALGRAMCCRFLVQRGCDPKVKTDDGLMPRLVAKEAGSKACIKELKKGEKIFGKVGKSNEPWAITLYDWSYTRQSDLLDLFKSYDPDAIGQIRKEDFVDCLQSLNAPLPEEEVKGLVQAHDKRKDGSIDYGEFLSGKRYLNKAYVMSAFEKKKKKGKKGRKKGKKKGKGKIPMPIPTRAEGERTEGGGPPEEFIVRQVGYTDGLGQPGALAHPLADDTAWYSSQAGVTYCGAHEAAKYGDIKSLQAAFAHGTSIDVRDKYYKTPLMTAAARGELNTVRFLILRGADVRAKDNFKWTALHHACHAGHQQVAACLLDNGADIDAPALNGGTALMRAIGASRLDVVQYLIERGANTRVANAKGQSPMDLAGSYADPRVYTTVKLKLEADLIAEKRKAGKKKGQASASSAMEDDGDGADNDDDDD